MKSILGIGNALTDILAVLPDSALLEKYNLPLGSMQHVDSETGNKIWEDLRELGIKYVAGGSAANTISTCAIFGMPSGFIGKVGIDEIGSLYKSDQKQNGINSMLLRGKAPSGRCLAMICGNNDERTFATYLGASLELEPEDLKESQFDGYDYLHLEGYLVQNQRLFRKAVEIGRKKNMIISVDLASYNVIESNMSFLHDIVRDYVDIVFANESESQSFTGKSPREAIDDLAKMCNIAVVKIGKEGSMVKQGDNFFKVGYWPAKTIDTTGAGDVYAGGFLYGHALGLPIEVCAQMGSIVSAKVVEVIGTKIDIPRWKAAKTDIRKLIGMQ